MEEVQHLCFARSAALIPPNWYLLNSRAAPLSPCILTPAPVSSTLLCPPPERHQQQHELLHATAGARLHAIRYRQPLAPGSSCRLPHAQCLAGQLSLSRCLPPRWDTALSTRTMYCSNGTIYYMIRFRYKIRAKGRRMSSWGRWQNRAPRSLAGPGQVSPFWWVLSHQCVQCLFSPTNWRSPALT